MMPRGRRWTDEENELIAKMYAEGTPIEEITEKLPSDRTPLSVKQQITRLGLKRGIVATKKKSIVATIEAAEIMSREKALKVLAGTIERLQEGREIDDVELARLRTIIAAIKSYFSVFESYEKYAELEARMKRLEAIVEQVLKKAEKS